MHLIKSGFGLELLRLISFVHDFLPDFEIELIRLIREKNFETLFSKVHDQVTHTSMCLCIFLLLFEKFLVFCIFYLAKFKG